MINLILSIYKLYKTLQNKYINTNLDKVFDKCSVFCYHASYRILESYL